MPAPDLTSHRQGYDCAVALRAEAEGPVYDERRLVSSSIRVNAAGAF